MTEKESQYSFTGYAGVTKTRNRESFHCILFACIPYHFIKVCNLWIEFRKIKACCTIRDVFINRVFHMFEPGIPIMKRFQLCQHFFMLF